MAAVQIFTPAVVYRDRPAAMTWLEHAFGFETSLLLTDAEGGIAHAEMSYDGGVIMISSEWADWTKSPGTTGGGNTQFLRVRLERDIDAHCERARRAGATITQEPADQFYGDRIYRAFDPEGHCWTFSQAVRQVSSEEMEKATGLTFKDKA